MRRRRNIVTISVVQDPGKDLFAYLFLLIMVFSFMLLMSSEERHDHRQNQAAPQNETSSASTSTLITTVNQEQLGRLIKNEKGLFLAFGDDLYDPAKDIASLKRDKRIVLESEGGGEKSNVLYLIEDSNSRVLLTEYLSAFQQLGSHGIRVAFAEKVL